MDAILKALLFLLVGVGLLIVNLWYVRTVWQAIAEPSPIVIAPFQIVGKDDAGQLGTTLASMLLARLGRIREEMKASHQELRAARREEHAPSIQTLEIPTPALGWLPERLFAPLDLKMTVGGVEVGGVLAWLQRMLTRDRLLHVAIHYDGERTVAVSHVGGSGDQALWIPAAGSNDEVVSAIAYALTHRHVARDIPEVEAFEAGEFRTLLSTLYRLAELNRQVARGRVAPQAYAELLPPLEGLVEKAPSWRDLARLTAAVAESAGAAPTAVALYQRELELTPADDPSRAAVVARLERLSQRIVATTPQTPERPAGTVAAYPLGLLGVTSVAMTRPPVIAVVGGVPPGPLDVDHYEILADLAAQTTAPATPEPTHDVMAEYTVTLVQAVQLVAPQARFLFAPVRAPRGATTMVELLRALERTIEHRPPILLVTLGPLEGPDFERVLQKAVSAGILVVIAAGNDPTKPAPFAEHPLGKHLMVVAATDIDGGVAKFTQRAPGVVWAPGERIPVSGASGRPDARAGTAYAAALASGIAARVLAEHPDLDRQRLLDVLRDSSRPVKPGGPPLLNLGAAFTKLSA